MTYKKECVSYLPSACWRQSNKANSPAATIFVLPKMTFGTSKIWIAHRPIPRDWILAVAAQIEKGRAVLGFWSWSFLVGPRTSLYYRLGPSVGHASLPAAGRRKPDGLLVLVLRVVVASEGCDGSVAECAARQTARRLR